jgi:hypothetical protein
VNTPLFLLKKGVAMLSNTTIIDEMEVETARAGRVKGFLSLLLMVFTGSAAVLFLLGTLFSQYHSLRFFGELLTLPALVVALFPILAAGFLVSIWTARGTVRLIRPQRTVLYSVSVELPPAAPAVSSPVLSDEAIFRYLMSLDARIGGDSVATKARHNTGWMSVVSLKEPTQRDEDLPSGHLMPPSPEVNPVAIAAAKNIECVEIDSYRTYVLKVPAREDALLINSDFETVCTRILEQSDQIEKLVIDGRGLNDQDTQKLCDCIVRLARRFREILTRSVRVIFSLEPAALISDGRLWHAVQRNNGNDISLYKQLLDILLGPPAMAL